MRQQQVLRAQQGYGGVDLVHVRHAGREHDRVLRVADCFEQLAVGQRSRRNFDARRPELLDEVDGIAIPAGNEPVNFLSPTIVVDLLEFLQPELDLIAIVEVGDIAPGGLSHLVAHLGRDAFLGRAFLKFHRVTAAGFGHVDQPLGDVEATVMVDADFGDHIVGAAVAGGPAFKLNSSRHNFLLPHLLQEEVT